MEFSMFKINEKFSFQGLKRNYILTLIFLTLGLSCYGFFVLIAFKTPSKSFVYYFLQNVGIFLLFMFVLMAFGGVYRITTSPRDLENITMPTVISMLKRTHYFFSISLITVIVITVVILIQVGISAIGMIPQVGPILLSLLTIPYVIVNFICALAAVCIFSVFPPLASEVKTFGDLFIEFKISIKERWVNVVLYVVISISILTISLIVIHFIAGFAVGVTHAIQGSLAGYYPKIVNAITVKSYFTDIVSRVAIHMKGIGMIARYDLGPFTYGELLNYIFVISYIILFSCVISLPLSVYFTISSVFFGKVEKTS